MNPRAARALAVVLLVGAASGAILRRLDERPSPLPARIVAAPSNEEERWTLGLPLRINRASQGAIELLPGIGPSRARDIVRARDRQGGLRSLAELDAVKGIGPVTLAQIGPQITFEPASGGEPPVPIVTKDECACAR